MDEKGDAEGNYTLIGRQKHIPTPGEYGLYPVGGFRYSVGDYRGLPVRGGKGEEEGRTRGGRGESERRKRGGRGEVMDK